MNNTKLFCKPAPGTLIKNEIDFRSLDLIHDLSTIHRWVSSDYAKRFWQLDITQKELGIMYQHAMESPDLHSFIGLFNGEMVCQLDLYRVAGDELGSHVVAGPNDCGMHLLMAPLQAPISGLSGKVIQSFLEYYFSHPEAENMYGEPDSQNEKALRLLERSGFVFQRTIKLTSKTAALYLMTRKQFYATHQQS